MAQPQNNINSITVSSLPPNIIVNRSYNVNKQLEYEGHAIKGTADSDRYWTVRKFTYVSNQVTQERLAYNISWDDRTLATFN